VIVHGGSAEEGGDKARMRSRAEWYAKQGAVVVTPNYRYEEGKTVSDVACALATAQANATRFGANGERMVVHGFSFGGWLTSFALFAGDVYGMGDCAAQQPARPLAWIGESTQTGNANKSENIYNDIVPDGRDGAINYLDAKDAALKVLLLHGTEDPKFNEQRAQDFADAFHQQGGSATVHLYQGFGHSARLTDNATTQRDVLEFLESLE
jgi:dienelactone hydrolase